MCYSKLFFELLVNVSLVSLFGVFVFQLWAFFKDFRNKDL